MSSTRQFLSSPRLLSTLQPRATRPTAQFFRSAAVFTSHSSFHTSKPSKMANRTLKGEDISNITHKESQLTGQPEPVKGGPTAQAQKHVRDKLDGNVVSDIAKGEENITHLGGPIAGGPSAAVQSEADQARVQDTSTAKFGQPEEHTGILDSRTISDITQAESKLTGQDEPVRGGPTAKAQKHVNEPINSETLHDITEGEKKVTGGERVPGGPTSTAQSELAKSRQG